MKKLDVSTLSHPNTFALVDDEDFERANKYKWHAAKTPRSHTLYVIRSEWMGCRYRTASLHRFIMGATHGDGKMIDHLSRNGLDCQKSNMRFCTYSENNLNRKWIPGQLKCYIGIRLSLEEKEEIRRIVKVEKFKTVSAYIVYLHSRFSEGLN